jgi:anti-anti-sigma factor
MSTPSSPVTSVLPLHIDTNRLSPTLARVSVIGEVDLATVTQLRDRLTVVLHDQAPAVVEVDLAGVSFLDCAGIGALVAVRHLAVDAGQRMYVSSPGRMIRRMLELTELLDVLTAPIDQPGEPPSKSDHPAGTEPDPTASALPPDLVAVA